MADICGVTPEKLDRLSLIDFLVLISGIDGRRQARKSAAENGVWIP